MSDTPLATVAQLGAYLSRTIPVGDPSATLMLDIASGMIRDYLQRNVTAVTADVETIDPVNGTALLANLPIGAVSLVETFDGTSWVVRAATTYTVSLRTGVVSAQSASAGVWPVTPGSWRVTYDHGFNPVPMAIVGVCLGVAARALETPAGVEKERVGGYQVKYAMESEGFSAIEQKALNRYVTPRVG